MALLSGNNGGHAVAWSWYDHFARRGVELIDRATAGIPLVLSFIFFRGPAT
jgi:hypothetical protein